MSSQKTSNNDSCRDLSGRRLSTIKEAKKCVFSAPAPPPSTTDPSVLVIDGSCVRARFVCFRLAEYLEQEPARKKAAAAAQRAKLEALERKLGIEGGPGSSSSGDAAQVAGRKHRFDDTEYLEQNRELVDNVKSAVTAGQNFSFSLHGDPSISSLTHCLTGLLKKRRKAKADHSGTKSKQEAPKAPSLDQPVTPQAPPSLSTHGTEEISVVNTAAVGA